MWSIIYRGSLSKWDNINNSIEKMVKDWENISPKGDKNEQRMFMKIQFKTARYNLIRL